jgi:Sec-independent protein translocase protein TatA
MSRNAPSILFIIYMVFGTCKLRRMKQASARALGQIQFDNNSILSK